MSKINKNQPSSTQVHVPTAGAGKKKKAQKQFPFDMTEPMGRPAPRTGPSHPSLPPQATTDQLSPNINNLETDIIKAAMDDSVIGPTPAQVELYNEKKIHSGLMVCLYLPPRIQDELAIPDGEPAEDLHVTLCYIKVFCWLAIRYS